MKILVFGDAQVIIVPSGWAGYYHVIIEDPNEGDLDYEHEFLWVTEVCTRYNLKPDTLGDKNV